MKLLPELEKYVKERTQELNSISGERKDNLQKLARYVQEMKTSEKPVKLIFICTHNSRRSHMAQIWAQTAAFYYGHSGIETYSGGTEATAFNPNAVKAMRGCGFGIDRIKEGDNPLYQVKFSEQAPPMRIHSKVFDAPDNPPAGFAAVMTCSHADENCPFIPGADLRVPITYEDPKAFDGTPQQDEAYRERSRQIAREMLYFINACS